jgi:hypothetical protein
MSKYGIVNSPVKLTTAKALLSLQENGTLGDAKESKRYKQSKGRKFLRKRKLNYTSSPMHHVFNGEALRRSKRAVDQTSDAPPELAELLLLASLANPPLEEPVPKSLPIKLTKTEITKMGLASLKAYCTQFGLSHGTKKEMVARLREHMGYANDDGTKTHLTVKDRRTSVGSTCDATSMSSDSSNKQREATRAWLIQQKLEKTFRRQRIKQMSGGPACGPGFSRVEQFCPLSLSDTLSPSFNGPCYMWQDSRSCRYGDQCNFTHDTRILF